jgi:hypothetical protein
MRSSTGRGRAGSPRGSLSGPVAGSSHPWRWARCRAVGRASTASTARRLRGAAGRAVRHWGTPTRRRSPSPVQRLLPGWHPSAPCGAPVPSQDSGSNLRTDLRVRGIVAMTWARRRGSRGATGAERPTTSQWCGRWAGSPRRESGGARRRRSSQAEERGSAVASDPHIRRARRRVRGPRSVDGIRQRPGPRHSVSTLRWQGRQRRPRSLPSSLCACARRRGSAEVRRSCSTARRPCGLLLNCLIRFNMPGTAAS